MNIPESYHEFIEPKRMTDTVLCIVEEVGTYALTEGDLQDKLVEVSGIDMEWYHRTGFLFVTESYTKVVYLLRYPKLRTVGQKGGI
jgi:hypothetical protein